MRNGFLGNIERKGGGLNFDYSNCLTGETQDLIFTLFMFFFVLCLVLVVWKNNEESFGSCLFLPFSQPRTNDEIDLEKMRFFIKKNSMVKKNMANNTA